MSNLRDLRRGALLGFGMDGLVLLGSVEFSTKLGRRFWDFWDLPKKMGVFLGICLGTAKLLLPRSKNELRKLTEEEELQESENGEHGAAVAG